MPFHTYVLINPSGRLYIGSTGELDIRMEKHHTGESRWTSSRGPWELAYSEQFTTRAEAMARERYLKTGVGRDWLNKKLNL